LFVIGTKSGGLIVNEEVIIDWIFMSLIPLIVWFLGYLGHLHVSRVVPGKVICVPSWLAMLAGRKRNNLVELRGFIWQIWAWTIFLLSTFLALFEPDHQKRVLWFRIGFALSLFGSAILLAVLSLSSRRK
jgi:hypothetical protein